MRRLPRAPSGFVTRACRVILPASQRSGGMAEWLKAHAWKACIRETVSWVRIPLPPPERSSLLFATVHKASIFPVLFGDRRLYVSVGVRYNPTNCCGTFCRIGRKVQYGGMLPERPAQPGNGRRDLCRTSSID